MGARNTNLYPDHVAIIMDGNGRWARKRAMPRYYGHSRGVEALKKAVRFAKNNGISTLTVYAFSTENWQRPKDEVNFLIDLMYKTFVKELDELNDEGVKIIQVGDKLTLTPAVRKLWADAEAKTKDNTELTLNVAFNYGARIEIIQAVQKIATMVADGEVDAAEINEDLFQKQLYTSHSPDPDLLIRTGGELRLSNYLLWQTAYTELYVTDILWPDFDEREFSKALDSFARRERRFGNVSRKEMEG